METTDNISNNRNLIEHILNRNDNRQQVSSDEELHQSDNSNLHQHNAQFTALLEAYVKAFEKNSTKKIENKQEVFKIAKFLLLSIPISTIFLLFITLFLLISDKVDVLEILPGLTAALISLIGTFVVIPKMIIKYLFNKEEEKYLAEIIGKIQEYDKNIRDKS